ncbi:MAG: 3'-5' exonuclease, partial [Gammaproteobacteria bacterium]|nr:3'-5' exonuclease [Gammaproteobacteria bacterium]
HIDLMDVLAGYQARAFAPLDQMASMLGFPGKMGMTGADVWDHFRAGKVNSIRAYCETDVLNTYLIFLKFQHLRGHLQDAQLRQELDGVRDYLKSSEHPHLQEFLSAWDAVSSR